MKATPGNVPAARTGIEITPAHRAFFHALPKVELHCHLLGAVRHDTFVALAERSGAPIERAEIDAFYARGDTATPVRATIAAVAVNIALKIALVWGAHLGATGIALGTALAAWVNVVLLVVMARSRGLLTIDAVFLRSLPPTFLATFATGAGALLGVWAGSHLHFASGTLADEISLACAILCGGAGFALVTLLFRHSLPLGRLARRRT